MWCRFTLYSSSFLHNATHLTIIINLWQLGIKVFKMQQLSSFQSQGVPKYNWLGYQLLYLKETCLAFINRRQVFTRRSILINFPRSRHLNDLSILIFIQLFSYYLAILTIQSLFASASALLIVLNTSWRCNTIS